ncbi:MAG: AI-2E family transporter [Candidatus Izemoplasmatales bacterium]|nr:AI-2E family transporter [Candidatus Izemoplasmatales bacterium]MDD3864914.1 AI-2E family transporter [Candidatus Izemoplasmatales bacterium]
MRKKLFSDETLTKIIKILAIVLLVLVILYMASQFSDFWNWIFDALKSVLVPVGLGYLIALIVFPLIKYLEKKGIGPRGLSLAIVFIIMAGIIFAAFYFVMPMIINEITNFFTTDFVTITDYLTTDMRDDFFLGTDIYDQILNYVTEADLVNSLLNDMVPSLIASLTNVAVPIITTISVLPFILLYYLRDYEMIGERLRGIVPQKHEKNAAELGSRLNRTVGKYLQGQLILMVAIGSVATIVYKLIGLNYFYIFGIIVGVTNIIPYFGAIIAAIPPIIYAFIANANGFGPGPFLVLGVNLLLQFIEGNIFQPIIMGHQLQMHPLVIILSILFFGSLFGTFGVVFASPIAASIRVLYQFNQELKQAKMGVDETKGVKDSG